MSFVVANHPESESGDVCFLDGVVWTRFSKGERFSGQREQACWRDLCQGVLASTVTLPEQVWLLQKGEAGCRGSRTSEEPTSPAVQEVSQRAICRGSVESLHRCWQPTCRHVSPVSSKQVAVEVSGQAKAPLLELIHLWILRKSELRGGRWTNLWRPGFLVSAWMYFFSFKNLKSFQ